jgi:hypothetical protein
MPKGEKFKEDFLMKTTKRSKMLLSSIAMLLVALVALGSATYAWYSINRSVSASPIQITAATPGGLKISEQSNTGWADSITWSSGNTAASMQPSCITFNGSSASGVKDVQVSDSDSTTSARSGESLGDAPIADTNYYIAKDIYLLNQNSMDGTITCTITATGANNSYVALALVDATATTDDVIFTQVSSGNGSGPKDAAAATFDLTGAGTAETNAQKHFYVVAYVDGQNSNCTTANAASAGAVSFNIEFTMADKTA